jgi:hypothetical protein
MNTRSRWWVGAGVVVFAVVVTAAVGAFALHGSRTAAAGPTRAGAQGIHVSGKWSIVVRRPDGTVVSRQRFENALLLGGQGLLADFLSRTKTVGRWEITLTRPAVAGVPQPTICNVRCELVEVSDPYTFGGVDIFHVLNVTEGTGFDLGKVILKGSFTATQTGEIHTVQTRLSDCPATTAPSPACGNTGSSSAFTHKDISATPLAASAGQQVDVTVTISFS